MKIGLLLRLEDRKRNIFKLRCGYSHLLVCEIV